MSEALWSPPPVGRRAATLSHNLDRPALVLLPGMLGDARLWDPLARLINDLVKPWPVRIDLDDSVTELAAAVLAQAPARFHLGGHSLGGIVALEVQRLAPERVLSLVLINSSARGPSERQRAGWTELDRRVQAGEFEAIADELAVATLPPDADEQVRRVNRAMAAAVGADGLRRQLAAQQSRPDYRPRLTSLAGPTLVFGGELDRTCPLELQRELVAASRSAELVELAGVAHMAPLEAPEPIAERLRDWFVSVAPAGAGALGH